MRTIRTPSGVRTRAKPSIFSILVLVMKKIILICALALCSLGLLIFMTTQKVPEAPTNAPDEQPESAMGSEGTILAFGDSLTAGYGLSQSQSYPSQLKETLRRLGYDYEVINAGLSGDTSTGAVNRINFSLQDNPDIVIITIGGNDFLRGLPADEFKSNLEILVERSQAAGARVVIAALQAPENLGSDYARQFNQAYTEVSQAYDTELIPFFLEGVALESELNLDDGIHPNEQGYAKIVENNVLPIIEPLL